MNQFLLLKDAEETHDRRPFASSLNAELSFLFFFHQKRPEPRRSPTVGLPYGPSRSSSHRQVHVQHLDLGKYGYVTKMAVKQIDNYFQLDVKMFKT